MSEIVTRPALRYHGGKWRIAPWVISYFPQHRYYVEPFGGGASVLLRKARSYAEVYNDIDNEIVNLFRVLRDDEQSRRLVQLVELTPYSREEFNESYDSSDDPVEWARRTVTRSYLGFGTMLTGRYGTGFRGNVRRPWKTPCQDWAEYPAALWMVAERLRGVVIENSPAMEILRKHDDSDALFYVDPPYPFCTRNDRRCGGYRYEMSDDDHRELAEILHRLQGMVVLSGYRCELYSELYSDWRYVSTRSYADRALPREEVLWLSPNADRVQISMF
jgi:DNA adenine methylase